MIEAHWLLIALIVVSCFLVGWVIVHVMLRVFRKSTTEDDEETTREAEALHARAEQNVKAATELAARAKRLEQMVSIQKRGRP